MEWSDGLDFRSAAQCAIPPQLHQRLISVSSSKIYRGSEARALQDANNIITVDINASATAWEAKLDQARQRRAQLLQGRRNKAASQQQQSHKRHPASPPPTRDAAAARLQHWWRGQLRVGNTTPALIATYIASALPVAVSPGGAVIHRRAPSDRQLCDAFDMLAARMADPGTLQAAKALLLRLEHRLPRQPSPRVLAQLGRLGSTPSQRYAPRVLLAAYMMVAHPAVVLGDQSTTSDAVKHAAARMLHNFHAMLSEDGGRDAYPFAHSLMAFDRAWMTYVECFVAWKMQDAAVLEGDLVRMAVEMELSLARKIGPRGRESPRIAVSPDLQAMCEQVERDQLLMRERLVRVGGQQAGGRMDGALQAVRAAMELTLQSAEE